MENLCGALVRQSIGLYLSDFLRLFTIHTISELSTFNRSRFFFYKKLVLFICYYNGNTRLNYGNPRLTLLIRDLRKCQAISCQLDFNSCFLLYPDQQFCNLHPHACSICGTNDTSRNVTRCSNPNAHAQFPWAVPYLIILDHCWFLYHEHSYFKSAITVLRSIIHLNLK